MMTREVIARTPPPAILFPYQQCQRPDQKFRPHRLTPGSGEERRSSRHPFECQPILFALFSREFWKLAKGKNEAVGSPRRPSVPSSESIEAAVFSDQSRETQAIYRRPRPHHQPPTQRSAASRGSGAPVATPILQYCRLRREEPGAAGVLAPSQDPTGEPKTPRKPLPRSSTPAWRLVPKRIRSRLGVDRFGSRRAAR